MLPKLFRHALVCLLLALAATACGKIEKTSEAPKPDSEFADFGGLKVHYLDYDPSGGKGKEPLVLVHGWSCNAEFWKGQADYFGRERRVLVVDLPGHGQSDAPEIRYNLDLFARGVGAAMRHAGVEHAVVAGHSMGAPVARRLARLEPGKVDGLVLVDGAFLLYPETEPGTSIYRNEMEKFTGMFHSPKYKDITRSFVESMFSDRTGPETRTFILDTMTSTPQHVMASSMDEFINPENWLVPPMDKPTLAIYAKGGEIDETFMAYVKGKFPNVAYKEWAGYGHFLMMEDPARFNDELEGFLKEFDARAKN